MQRAGWLARRSVWMRRIVWGAGIVVLLYLLAWLALPPILRAQLEKQGSEILGRRVTVAQVAFSPWSLELTLRGLQIANAAGDAPQVQVERIYANAAVQSLWHLAPVIDALQVDAPKLRFAQTAPGAFDFDDVLQRLAQRPSPPSDEPARFALYNLQLQGGEVDFDDRTVDVRHTVRQLALDIPFLSNLAADRQVTVTPRLALELDGSAFDSSAQATPFADSRQTSVRMQLKDFDLAPLAAYVPASLPLKLRAGTLDVDLGLEFSEHGGSPKVRLSGSVRLGGLDVADAAGAPLLAFEQLQVALDDVRPLERQVRVASVEWQSPRVHLRRDASGKVVLPIAAPDAGAAAPPQPPGSSAVPWTVSVQQVQVRDGAADWQDESLPESGGHRAWQVRGWQAQVTDAAWPLEQPLHFSTEMQVSGGAAAGAPARVQAQGEVTAQRAQVALSVNDLSLALAAPYLAGLLKPELAGVVDAKLQLERYGEALLLKLPRLALAKASLSCAEARGCPALREAGVANAAKGAQIALQGLEITDASVDLQQHRVALGQVTLQQPQILVARDKAGAWMFADWLAPSPAAHEHGAPPAAAPPPWSLKMGGLQLKGGTVALRDAAAPAPVALNLSALDVGVRDFAWSDGRMPAFGLRVQTRVGAGRADPGQLSWDGTLALAPALEAKGRVRARNLPLQVLQPYVAQGLNVDVLRADGGFVGDVRVADAPAGFSVGVQGDVALDEVHVRVASAQKEAAQPGQSTVGERGEDLLRWKSLALRGVSLGMAPGKPLALEVQETALSDFFARVIVQESGRINLQDIRSSTGAQAPQAAEAAADTEPAGDAPRIRFGPVALTNGTVDFTDHFIKPNYSANLTQLTGRLSAFSSEPAAPGAPPQMAQLELKGRAQGTATLDVSGQLNPLAKPLALDIQGHMHDLELPPLSPYSVKYAGHGIERGKLSMDVAYKVQPDGQLSASNKLVLKQLAFGDQVEGAPASLPVRLAVALLADRNGVIDVDLPISGSLNDPEFRLGPVILKVIGNLIMKAVTAPFSLLASAFAGGDEQGAVAFSAGSSDLGAKAREQLDAIAKALADRPALKATVVGWADPAAEQQAWKRERLQGLLLAQKRRAAVQGGKDATAVTQVSAEEYPALLKEAYRRADDIAKPRNLVGLAKDIPQAEMEKLLLDGIAVPGDAMQELALARSVAVRDYLAAHQVPIDRLFVGASKLQGAGEKDKAFTPHAELQLSAR